MELSYEKKPVKSVAEFIDAVFCTIQGFQNERIIWFRGECDVSYDLVPNLYRNGSNEYSSNIILPGKVRSLEENMDMSFYRKASVFLSRNGIENTPWNRYFLKQHYGVKTRLLDWTENALYALFFAVNKKENTEDGRVWILLPFELNDFTAKKLHPACNDFHIILTCGALETKQNLINENGELNTKELLRKYYRMDCNNGEELYPLAIYPPHIDERMSAQQACFTIFGNITRGLNFDGTNNKFLKSVRIAGNSKKKILSELRILGISDYSIYPDLEGLSKTINYDNDQEISNIAFENNRKMIEDFSSFMNGSNSKLSS